MVMKHAGRTERQVLYFCEHKERLDSQSGVFHGECATPSGAVFTRVAQALVDEVLSKVRYCSEW